MIRPPFTPADLGALVRATRKAQGLRQDALAKAAGVGLRFIVELEAGKPTIQLGKALQVLATLGCGLEVELPTEPGSAPAPESGPSPSETPRHRALWRRWL